MGCRLLVNTEQPLCEFSAATTGGWQDPNKFPVMHGRLSRLSRQQGSDREPYRTSASSSCRCFCTGASVFAVIMPEAAAAGTPMPGAHESPHLCSLQHAVDRCF
jgi:hypothetical protein